MEPQPEQPNPALEEGPPPQKKPYQRVENPRYVEPLVVTLFVVVGSLAVCQVGLTAARVSRSQDEVGDGARYSWGWFNRLCLMLFTACWTLFYALIHWMLNLYASMLFLIITVIFWVVACILWQIVVNLTPNDCDGTSALSTCRRLVGIDVLGWTILGWVTLLLVAFSFYWARDMRGIGFHNRGCRTTYLDTI